MKFVYPEFLFAFLVLLVPIIIHLFNFKRYKTLYFSSLQFLKRVDEQTKSTQKLKHLLVLLLRLLAFSALVLAFAQPYIPSEEKGSKSGQPVMGIYMDNSYSMSAVGAEGLLLEQAKEAARKIIDEADLGTQFVLMTNEIAVVDQRVVNKQQALDRIDEIGFSAASNTFSNPLNTMKDVVEREEYTGQNQYIVLGDFQKSTYDFEKLDADTSAIYYPIQLVPQNTNNIFIDSVWFNEPLRRVRSNNELNVRVVNTGKEPLNNIELELNVNNYNRDYLIDLPAKGSETIVLNYTDQDLGLKKGSVEVNDESVFFDDAYHFSYAVKETTNVTLINGVDAPLNPDLVYQTDNYYNVRKQNINQLSLNELVAAELIVLNSVQKLSGGLIGKLKEHVERGGSLLIIPHIETDLSSYNALLTQLGMSPLQPIQSSGLKLSIINYSSPFFTGVFEREEENIHLPKIERHFTLQYSSQSTEEPLVSFQNKTPFFVRHGQEHNVYLFTGGITPEFGALNKHAIFTVLLLRVAELASQDQQIAFTLGKDNLYRLNSSFEQGQLKMTTDEMEWIPPIIQKKGFKYISLGADEIFDELHAGHYDIRSQGDLIDILSMNYQRNESRLKSFKYEEIEQNMKQLRLNFVSIGTVSDHKGIKQLSLKKPTEYWRILLILTLVFLIAEMMILRWWKI